MPVQVILKGSFDPVVLSEDFAGTAVSLQMAAAQGRMFLAGEDMDGRTVMLSMPNILTITELDEDDPACLLA